MSRVLVTGGTGFVGQTLVRALLEREKAVSVAVREARDLVSGVALHAVGSIDGNTDFRDALSGCDAVVHLAARVHVMREARGSADEAYQRTNVQGTLQLARQAAGMGVRRFVFVSSIKVNGERTEGTRLFRETDPPVASDAYGRSKADAEAGLRALAATSGMEVVIVRPPLVYGAGVRANFLALMRWIALGRPLPLGAIRTNGRSLVFVDNLVDLLCRCLEHPSAANETFMAADADTLSTAELVESLASALRVRARLFSVPIAALKFGGVITGRDAAVSRLTDSLRIDTTKARAVLGWSPPASVEQGLQATAAWYLARTAAP